MSKSPACPRCGPTSKVVKNGSRTLKTAGRVQVWRCKACQLAWSARTGTVLDGLRTPPEKIAGAIHARTEGVGVRATARLARTSPQSVRRWEKRLADHDPDEVLPPAADFTPIIESDELYTKVHHNRPAHESPGWTLISLERQTRYWVATATGRRTRPLFDRGMRQAWARAGQRPSVWLSDGETRYEQALWPLAQTWLRGPGRPPKRPGRRKGTRLVWRRDVLVARKIKGSQCHSGQVRRRERADRLHPWTADLPDAAIHANHPEAFNASLRRRCSAFRRRTNTYAKDQAGLDRSLAVQRRVYNYARPHPGLERGTTPAMAVGLTYQPWSLLDLLYA